MVDRRGTCVPSSARRCVLYLLITCLAVVPPFAEAANTTSPTSTIDRRLARAAPRGKRPVFLFVAGLEGSGHHSVQSALKGCGPACAAHVPLSTLAYTLCKKCLAECAGDVVSKFKGFLEAWTGSSERLVPINCGGAIKTQLSYPDDGHTHGLNLTLLDILAGSPCENPQKCTLRESTALRRHIWLGFTQARRAGADLRVLLLSRARCRGTPRGYERGFQRAFRDVRTSTKWQLPMPRRARSADEPTDGLSSAQAATRRNSSCPRASTATSSRAAWPPSASSAAALSFWRTSRASTRGASRASRIRCSTRARGPGPRIVVTFDALVS